MPLLNTSASTADSVYQVSFVVLMLGTALVLLSALALIWSNTIRERATAEQLANLGDLNARANAEVQKARAEVVAAHLQVAEANSAAARAVKEIGETKQDVLAPKAIVAGRMVTAESCGLFINFVKTVSKGRVVVEAISSNAEAMQFARQVADMLKSAGYDAAENFGSSTLLGAQPIGVQMKIRSMDDQPIYAGSLQKGLEFIGIATSGQLDATAGDSVIIFVGSNS